MSKQCRTGTGSALFRSLPRSMFTHERDLGLSLVLPREF